MPLLAPDTGYRLQVMLCELTCQTGTCTKVALKQPVYEHTPKRARIDMGPTEKDMHMLATEGTTHEKMRHPHIVEYMGCLQGEGTLGLLMEYCPLKARDALQSCSVGQLLRFLLHALKAMQHVHARDYVHLDVKIDNFVACRCGETSDPWYKLTDFGLSVLKGTTVSEKIGTETHIAPEVYNSDRTPAKVTPAADVYSFAVMVVELLAVIPLHDPPCPDDICLEDDFVDEEEEPLVPEQRWSKVLWLKPILAECLNSEPSKRPIVAELLQTVQTQLHGLTPDRDVLLVEALASDTDSANTTTKALPDASTEVPEVAPETTPTVRPTLLRHCMLPVRDGVSFCTTGIHTHVHAGSTKAQQDRGTHAPLR